MGNINGFKPCMKKKDCQCRRELQPHRTRTPTVNCRDNTLIPVNTLRLSQTIINVVNTEGKPKAIVPTGAGVLQPPPALPRCAHTCARLLTRLLPLLLLAVPGAIGRSECQAHVAAVALQMKQCDQWKISIDAGCLAVLMNAGARLQLQRCRRWQKSPHRGSNSSCKLTTCLCLALAKSVFFPALLSLCSNTCSFVPAAFTQICVVHL